jgi:MscS family membrane protein
MYFMRNSPGSISILSTRLRTSLIAFPTILLLSAGGLYSQAPAAPAAESKDPLGRTTPQSSVIHFLEAAHARDYSKAAKFLDLRQMPVAERVKAGPELAKQLEDLLDDTPFDIATLGRDPEGETDDDYDPQYDALATFRPDNQTVTLALERIQVRPDSHVWVVSAPSVGLIPLAHKVVSESPFERTLPQLLVSTEILDTPVWRWIALIILLPVIWYLSGLVVWAFIRLLKPLITLAGFHGPMQLCLAITLFRAAVNRAPPSTLPRLVIERGLALGFFLGVAWAGAVVVELAATRFHSRLDPRVQTVSFSVLPLVTQLLKLTLYLIAVLSVISAWGYNTSTILAGLGVGGLAVALAAQKTIENLFGGISVIGDRPVLVGDVCRFDSRIGTVTHIGLRSTKLRTPDRSIISVPNAQFSSMSLENLSARDKMWFHPTLNLRRDTTAARMEKVVSSIRDILAADQRVEEGKLPVRFVGLGQWSLDVEVNVYIKTSDGDQFLAVQQELLLRLLKAVQDAGAALAVPVQESVSPTAQT